MNSENWKQKIGQFFLISFEGMEPPPIVGELIRDHHIGGAVLFGSNCPTLERTWSLVQDLKSKAMGLPLALAVDHEGGMVHRFPKPITHFPPMREVGNVYEKIPSTRMAFDVGMAMGQELKALGFDFNFAPVADVDTNPCNPVIGNRSFSNHPEVAAMAVSHFIDGLQKTEIAACAKHFPGHGDTDHDSHKLLPRLPHNMKRLQSLEMIPFQSAIAQNVAMIMTAHVVYDGVDKNIPATFSVKILRDLLRETLGFQGVIVSDSLSMGAVTNHRSLEEAAVEAFLAGCDLLILSKNPEETPSVLAHFYEAVEKGVIPLERLEASYSRIVAMKERFCSKPSGEKKPNFEVLGCKEHKEIINKIKYLSR